jgi:hypothetical protein
LFRAYFCSLLEIFKPQLERKCGWDRLDVEVAFLRDYRRAGAGKGVRDSLPRPFDTERAEARSFAVIEIMFNETVDAAAARTPAEAGSQFSEVFWRSGCEDFDIAILGVSDPAA